MTVKKDNVVAQHIDSTRTERNAALEPRRRLRQNRLEMNEALTEVETGEIT